jgi:hypothetical protein
MLWVDVTRNFTTLINNSLKTNISDQSKVKLKCDLGLLNTLIKEAQLSPRDTFTYENLERLIESWNNFLRGTKGSDYWHKEFPEWSFMITQFQILILEELIHHPVHRDSRKQYDKVGQPLEILLSKLK